MRAHPRVCGENLVLDRLKSDRQGSSPRVRGKRTDRALFNAPGRLIPACAGKTPVIAATSRRFWAHPRVCGENESREDARRLKRGSSPRVRGKRIRARSRCGYSGLIPACAGKTSSLAEGTNPAPAHPRVCGENGEFVTFPRTSPGLIPACAGKTRRFRNDHRAARAHPRVCGENAFFVGMSSGVVGSSPRVRGKH